MDFDGNGLVDLVYMARLKAPVLFGVEQVNGAYTWKGRVTKVATQQLPMLDLANPTYQGKARMLDVKIEISYGCIEKCAKVDEPILSYFIPEVAAGDGSGWMWRTTQSHVTGASEQLRHRVWVTHDDRGGPVASTAELRDTLPLVIDNY
jgi:hypothetical protein